MKLQILFLSSILLVVSCTEEVITIENYPVRPASMQLLNEHKKKMMEFHLKALNDSKNVDGCERSLTLSNQLELSSDIENIHSLWSILKLESIHGTAGQFNKTAISSIDDVIGVLKGHYEESIAYGTEQGIPEGDRRKYGLAGTHYNHLLEFHKKNFFLLDQLEKEVLETMSRMDSLK